MKRTKKSKGKQEKPIKVQQVNKTAELQPTQTGNKCIPAAVGAAIIIFGLNYFFMFSSDFKTLNENAYNLSLFVSIAVSLSAIAGICYGKNKTFQSVLKYVFALLLLFQIIPQSLLFIDTSEFGANFATHIVMLQKFLLIPLAALGVILLWVLRKKNITEPNTIKSQNLALKTIFSKPGKQTFSASIAFIIILGISAGAVFHKLDYFSLYSDEAQVTHAAVGFAKSGEFKKWDFVKDEISDRTYTRAWPHIAVMGYTYRLFGISDWTSRLPSAVFGLLLTVLGFFITRFFTKSTLTALIVMLSFGLYFEFLLLTRWARMYAMIFPLFLLMLYFGYRIFTEPLTTKEKISGKLGRFFNEYLNFNYKLLPVFLILLFINISLHNNTAIALPILYLFLIISGLIYREKKFIIPVLIGLLIIISHLISPFLFGYGHITAFEIDNSDIYNRFFLGYPFNVEAGMALLIMGLTYFFFRKNKALNNAYILLYTATVFSWILFAYIIEFSISFRYMSMVAPFCVILLIGLFLQISKDIFGKKVQYAAALSVVGLIILNLSVRSNNLYVRNYVSPADPAMAWKKITKNYKKGEVIFKHWGPMLYFDKIDESANIRTIGSGKKYQMPLNELLDSLNNYPGGWLTWHTHNQYKLDTDIPIYCTHYFEKYAGYGIDTLGVEIYRYTEKMLKDTTLFKTDKHLPAANINLEDDFSITFGLNYQADTKSVPFIFSVEDKEVYQILVNKSEISLSYLPGTKTNINSQLDSDNQLNHIVIYQKGNKAGIILNGTKVSEKRIRKKVNDVVKFTINKTFRGNIDDIRIYDFAVNESQAQMIINNYNIPGTDKLTVNGESFRTLFHWQKR